MQQQQSQQALTLRAPLRRHPILRAHGAVHGAILGTGGTTLGAHGAVHGAALGTGGAILGSGRVGTAGAIMTIGRVGTGGVRCDRSLGAVRTNLSDFNKLWLT